MESEKRELAAAGPIARIMLTDIWCGEKKIQTWMFISTIMRGMSNLA